MNAYRCFKGMRRSGDMLSGAGFTFLVFWWLEGRYLGRGIYLSLMGFVFGVIGGAIEDHYKDKLKTSETV